MTYNLYQFGSFVADLDDDLAANDRAIKYHWLSKYGFMAFRRLSALRHLWDAFHQRVFGCILFCEPCFRVFLRANQCKMTHAEITILLVSFRSDALVVPDDSFV